MIYSLVRHPDTPSHGVETVSVQVNRSPDPLALVVEFHVASQGTLLIPVAQSPRRADELWKTTCFELFLMPLGQQRYVEFNLSPSFEWAAYSFEGYRNGALPHVQAWEPEIEAALTDDRHFFLYAELDGSVAAAGEARLALAAVIEETDGTKSYWALAHAPGPPDFHNPACFTATLPAPAHP